MPKLEVYEFAHVRHKKLSKTNMVQVINDLSIESIEIITKLLQNNYIYHYNL